jgi:formamidopyrimidine-DNA glycosylase
LVGREITALRTTRPSYFFLTPPATLKRRLQGRTVTALDRLGKYLLARLDDGSRLLLHLGMTGQLFSEGAASPRLLSSTGKAALAPEAQHGFAPDRHTHLVIEFAQKPQVFFRDTRKFGKVNWLAPGESDERIDRLGPDALRADEKRLFDSARGKRAAIKTLLLDQSVLAGVGNIYADEALFRAGVRPTRKAGRVTRAECGKIAQAVRAVLRRSIATGGSSISDYIAPDGADGRFQDERKVYAREGEACRVCRVTIKRLVIGQRSSHYCPRCQR